MPESPKPVPAAPKAPADPAAGAGEARKLARRMAEACASRTGPAKALAEAFLAMAKKGGTALGILDEPKLREVAGYLGIPVTQGKDGAWSPRDARDIAVDVGEVALAQWGQERGHLSYLKRAPKGTQDRWEKRGVSPRGIESEIAGILLGHPGDGGGDLAGPLRHGARCSLAEGWGAAMMAADLCDIMFGTPYPRLGILKPGILEKDKVNVLVQGGDPAVLAALGSAARLPGPEAHARSKGAAGYKVTGLACAPKDGPGPGGAPGAEDGPGARGGPGPCAFPQAELALMTGAVDALLLGPGPPWGRLEWLSACSPAILVALGPEDEGASGPDAIRFDPGGPLALERAKELLLLAADNFPRRGETIIPSEPTPLVLGFSAESLRYHLGGIFRGSFATLNDNIVNGRVRGVCALLGRGTGSGEGGAAHVALAKALIKNDVLVLATGLPAMACGMAGLLSPGTARPHTGGGLWEFCEAVGLAPALHLGGCLEGPRMLGVASEMLKAGGLGKELPDLPAALAAPAGLGEGDIGMAQCFVTSGFLAVVGGPQGIANTPTLRDFLGQGMEELYGGFWDFEPDPEEAARKILSHIDGKRKSLGIDKARERVLMDMSDRRALEGV